VQRHDADQVAVLFDEHGYREGTVQRHDADQVAVLFDEHGYREVSVLVVAGRGLLLQSAKARCPPARRARYAAHATATIAPPA